MSRHLRIFLSCVVALSGLFIGASWFIDQDWLMTFSPNGIIMVLNACICFVISAAGLLVHDNDRVGRHVVRFACGLFVVVFSALILSQDLLDLDLGLDQLFVTVHAHDYNVYPGRMAVPTSFCFILCGFALILLSKKRKRAENVLVQTLILTVMFASILGITGAFVRLELIYDWYQFGRMAIPTALGFLLLSGALWLTWYGQEAGTGAYLESEDRRIGATGIVIIAGVALTAGMTGFGLLASQMEQNLENGLRESFRNHSSLVQNEINSAIDASFPITTRLLLNHQLAVLDGDANNAESKQIITSDAESFIGRDTLAISIYTNDGQQATSVGTFTQTPELTIPIPSEADDRSASILWSQGQAILHLRLDIAVQGQRIGWAIVERRLPNIANLLLTKDLLGDTAETRICFALSSLQMQCLPSYRHLDVPLPEPRMVGKNILSMDFALRNQTGLRVARDYLSNKVISAYGPLGTFGLGMVVKINTGEFYGPLRQNLNIAIVLLALLSYIGILLQRVQLLPLVSRLVKSEERTKTIMANVGDGIITINESGIIQSVNPAVFEMFGYAKEDVIGQDVAMLMPHSMVDLHHAGMKRYLRDHTSHVVGKGAIELPARHADGHEFVILLTLSEMRLSDGRFFVGSMRDITERKRLDKLKSEFIATVSHELRTPLTSIRGSLGLVVGEAVGLIPERAKHLLDIAYKNCERLIVLINDILEIEKMESGQLHLVKEWTDVAALLREVIELNRPYAVKYDVTFQEQGDFATTQLFIDAARFTQIISNLLSNAAKFSYSEGVVEVSCQELPRCVRICVKDFGAGIPEVFRSRIFGKFAQADSSDARTKGGTGLGLSIAKTMVEQMGGAISFTSEIGVGTTFIVDFPRSEHSSSVHTDQTIERLGKILICEGDAEVATLLKETFETYGLSSDIAYTYAHAEDFLKVNAYCALTLDLEISARAGQDMFYHLRAHDHTAQLPVIVIAADLESETRAINGGALNVIDWLRKPIDPDRLLAAVLRLNSTKAMPVVLHVEDDLDISHIVSVRLQNVARVIQSSSLRAAEAALKDHEIDLVLLDIGLPDGSGLQLLETLNRVGAKPIPVVIFSAQDITQVVAKKVAAALVKSKTSEQELIATIISCMKAV